MIRIIEKWMNDGKHYWKGVVIYSSLPYCDYNLVNLFKEKRIPGNEKKLAELMDEAYMKEKANDILTSKVPESPAKPAQHSESLDLYMACKNEADKTYKDVMNKRAVLFSLANAGTPEALEQRRELSLAVAEGFPAASDLYDKADFVKKNGHLPNTKVPEVVAEPDVPDFMVWPTIDNMRKNINKMKKREQTPERIEMINKHTATLKKLEKRWHSLKQTLEQ